MYAKKLLPEYEYLAYGMLRHEVTDKNGLTTDITSRYTTAPIIPGPTIIMDEGDVAEITLYSPIHTAGMLRMALPVHGHIMIIICIPIMVLKTRGYTVL